MPPTPTATGAARSNSRKRVRDAAISVVYATKFGYDFYNYRASAKARKKFRHDFSPAFVRFALEQSLRGLETDTSTSTQMHNAQLEQVRNDELHALLEDVRARGQDPHVGRRAWARPSAGSTRASRRRATQRDLVQMIWNMLERYPGDDDDPAADERGANRAS